MVWLAEKRWTFLLIKPSSLIFVQPKSFFLTSNSPNQQSSASFHRSNDIDKTKDNGDAAKCCDGSHCVSMLSWQCRLSFLINKEMWHWWNSRTFLDTNAFFSEFSCQTQMMTMSTKMYTFIIFTCSSATIMQVLNDHVIVVLHVCRPTYQNFYLSRKITRYIKICCSRPTCV